LRDLDGTCVLSAGYQPTRVAADRYRFSSKVGFAEINRSDDDLECTWSVCVAADHHCELRRCRVVNHGDRTRRIELTSYLEWVLAARDADANHPAFSKLFVETQFRAERSAIVARRRPRSSDDPQTCGVHWLLCEGASGRSPDVEYETSRVAFIGRGRTIQRPHALVTFDPLTGFAGAVLDPIASLRTTLVLQPGDARACVFLLGAAQDSDSLQEMLAAFKGVGDAEVELRRAASEGEWRVGLAHAPTRLERPVGTLERVIVHGPHAQTRPQAVTAPKECDFLPAGAQLDAGAACQSLLHEPLQYDNGYGGFSADGREYVVRLQPDGRGGQCRPPMPWVNVIANPHAGFLVTESGAGYTWSGNSRLNRLTAWHNDPVCDPHSEAIWIRDEEAGVFWSPIPGPTPAPGQYIARHGLGYSRFEHEFHELHQVTTMFVASSDPVKITKLRLVNRSGRVRRLSVFAYAHWALGGLASETARSISTSYDASLRAILATNTARDHYGDYVAFSAVVAAEGERAADAQYTCDRAEFVGYGGDLAAPAALAAAGELGQRTGHGLDPCAAWRVPVVLMPGAWLDLTILLGEAPGHAEAAALIGRYRGAERASQALAAVSEFWRDMVSAIQIETPDREIDLVVNGWLTYQNLSCRMWGRSAYYQPGGALGYRDQLQDAAALVYLRPDITRAQIALHASQQFVEGDVLHWWHADTGWGLRTRFSDDLLWLPYVTAWYVATTGDDAILDEVAHFLSGAEVVDGHVEAYLCPTTSGSEATIYEHCCRALDRGLTTGAHGLPLIGCGDWNDGFSRVGWLGRGESVWLGFFIQFVLDRFMPICIARGDHKRVDRYQSYCQDLAMALNSAGWDGAWYRRAYYDHGEPLGSSQCEECQIDALAQAWAVLSGLAPPDRARKALDAVLQQLVCRDVGMIKLLSPPFNRTPHDPGYIKGYLPGIRENGGQYTHGVLWVVKALAEMGRGTSAVDLLRMLSPVWHAATAEQADVYQTEPYVVAADVYGEPPHIGRGGWTWYTGSAGWMFRVAVESVFGLSIDRERALVVRPAISASWPRCRLKYRLPGEATCYEIRIENPHGKESGVTAASIDGDDVAVEQGTARIPLVHDGGVHRVVIWL
jgi:cyclic beta-1,2-glucan synthetase